MSRIEVTSQGQVGSNLNLVTEVVNVSLDEGHDEVMKLVESCRPTKVDPDAPKSPDHNEWKSDKKDYNVWMSKRSYYRKMVKKYSEVVMGSDQAKVSIAKVKVAEYEERLRQSEIEIEAAKKKYGIGKRGGRKKVVKDVASDHSAITEDELV